MSKRIKLFLEDKYTFFPLLGGIFFCLVSFVLFYLKIHFLEGNIVFRFNSLKVIDLTGDSSTAFFIILSSFILFIFNQGLVYVFYFREKVLSYLISYSSLWIAFLSLVFTYFLTVIN